MLSFPKNTLSALLALTLVAPLTFANSAITTPSTIGSFMTSQDLLGLSNKGLLGDTASGITIINYTDIGPGVGPRTLNIEGLFISGWVLNGTNDGCTGTVVTPNGDFGQAAYNTQFIVTFTPVTLAISETTTVGKNYLFNLATQIIAISNAFAKGAGSTNPIAASAITCLYLDVTDSLSGTNGTTTLNGMNQGTSIQVPLTCDDANAECTAATTTIELI